MSAFEGGHALVAAIADYLDAPALPETVRKDGQDVYDLLRSPSCGYSRERTRLLLDAAATKTAILAGLDAIAAAAKSEDTVFVFFSGHGGRSKATGKYFVLPHDYRPGHRVETAISGEELAERLERIRSQRLLIAFDSCYAGGLGVTKGASAPLKGFAPLDEAFYKRLAQGKGRVAMASSRPDEVSLAPPHLQNSLFTHYLLEALRGRAGTRGDGLVRVFDVFDYLAKKVSAAAEQHPIFQTVDLEDNFPLALFDGGRKTSDPQEAPERDLPEVRVDQEVGRVAAGGELTGLEADEVRSGKVGVRQKVDVLEGRSIGARIGKLG